MMSETALATSRQDVNTLWVPQEPKKANRPTIEVIGMAQAPGLILLQAYSASSSVMLKSFMPQAALILQFPQDLPVA